MVAAGNACSLALMALVIFARTSGSEGLALLQAPASSTDFSDVLLDALQGNPHAAGPILYKTYDGAYYALAAETGNYDGIPADYMHRSISLGTDASQVLIVVDNQLRIVYLAFSAAQPTTEAMMGGVTLQPVTFLASLFAGGSPPSVSEAVWSGYAGAELNISTAISELSAGAQPVRLVCTGHAGGGAWAQLCGPWAQVKFPYANVRVITFGAPRIGDFKWNWAFGQLVDLGYLWATQSDDVPALPATLLPSNLTRIINDSGTLAGSGVPNSIEYIVTSLNNTIQGHNSNLPVTIGTNFTYGYLPSETSSANAPSDGGGADVGNIQNFVGSLQDSWGAVASTAGRQFATAIGAFFGGAGFSPTPAPFVPDYGALGTGGPTLGGAPGQPSATGGVPETLGSGHLPGLPILTKMALPVVQDCSVYFNGPDTIANGSVAIGPVESVGTNLAVAWNERDQVATFAFRGSSSTADWVQDFKLWLTESPTNGYFQELYPGTQVHAGFLDQFRAVTDLAQNDSINMLKQLNLLSNNKAPARIECSGHSLGGGLATLCGVWATEQWPQSDVRVVTFGCPKVGNIDFAQTVLAAVGRTYRVVNELDEVSALPPISSYVHVDEGLWVTNGTVLVDERPPYAFSSLSWDYHGCEDHYQPGIQTANGSILPQAVLQAS